MLNVFKIKVGVTDMSYFGWDHSFSRSNRLRYFVRDHLFSTYAKFPAKPTFLTPGYIFLCVRIRE